LSNQNKTSAIEERGLIWWPLSEEAKNQLQFF